MGGQGDILAGTIATFLGWGHARFKKEMQQQQQQQQLQQQQGWVVAAAAAACHVLRSAACMATASSESPRHVSHHAAAQNVLHYYWNYRCCFDTVQYVEILYVEILSNACIYVTIADIMKYLPRAVDEAAGGR